MMYILGIETSCDDTCIGITYNNEIIANVRYSHIIKNSYFGGIVPEICAREHTDCIDIVLKEALRVAKIDITDIKYIGVTVTPGLIGSLLVGGYFAYTLSKKLNIPLIPIHHIEAHTLVNNPPFPSDHFILSGGHSLMIRMEEFGKYEVICDNLDDSIGEYFDKIGRAMGLKFPAGPEIEKLANKQIVDSPLPVPMVGKPHFSFSGLKTETLKLIGKYSVEDICAFAQITAGKVIENKIKHFVKYPIIAGGGVVSNLYIRSIFEKYNAIFPPVDLCVDNGIMICRAAYQYILYSKPFHDFVILPQCPLDRWV